MIKAGGLLLLLTSTLPEDHPVATRILVAAALLDAPCSHKRTYMGIDVLLQTVNGTKRDEVLDPDYTLAKLLPIGDAAFPLLQYVDPYGDSIYNRQQMDQIVQELDVLLCRPLTHEEEQLLLRVRGLAIICKGSPHLFLRFCGD